MTTVQIPKQLFQDLIETGRRFSAIEDALENFLYSTDARFIKKMRRIRASHKGGNFSDWQKLKAKHGI
ncbi:MAG: hypothetical protein HYT98_05055 [Candidatus Sungbacteria bacterium]|nr:hypothetical protein [Candidatus Sungbacteria bacterium]